MTVRECYRALDASYDDVLRRMGNEERVKRFLLKLPGDGSFSTLCEAFAAGEFDEAFRAAHSLKGICMNLGLTPLAASSGALTEALRGGAPDASAAGLLERVRRDHRETMNAILALSDEGSR